MTEETPTELLANLARRGIYLEARGGRLLYRPKAAVSAALAESMRRLKPELLARLNVGRVLLRHCNEVKMMTEETPKSQRITISRQQRRELLLWVHAADPSFILGLTVPQVVDAFEHDHGFRPSAHAMRSHLDDEGLTYRTRTNDREIELEREVRNMERIEQRIDEVEKRLNRLDGRFAFDEGHKA